MSWRKYKIKVSRCDSPRYRAKYCAYSLMKMVSNEVISFPVIHISETRFSSTMEKEGFVHENEDIHFHGIKINITQIRKYVWEQPDLKSKHQFDVWHISKGMKKLTGPANKTNTEE